MKESAGLRFLYHTVPGRAVLKVLVQPGISVAAGKFLDSGCSRFLIKPFKKSNNISLDGIEIPEGGFPSFNSFFSRKRKPYINAAEENALVSPCDGYLSVFDIDDKCIMKIKHSEYSVKELLEDSALAEELSGGMVLIFRLTPADYHRYIFTDAGHITAQKTIPGELHCVRPIATESYPVYTRNSREYTVIETEHFGKIVQMEVGAMLVGRICNHPGKVNVHRGEEKGCFEYGGSTIVMMFKKDALTVSDSVLDRLREQEEVQVKQGQTVAFSGSV